MAYWLARLIFALFISALYCYYFFQLPVNKQKKLLLMSCFMPWGLMLVRLGMEVSLLNYSWRDVLPLYPCALMSILMVFFVYRPNYWAFTVLAYCSLVATLVALCVPNHLSSPWEPSIGFSLLLHILLIINPIALFLYHPSLQKKYRFEWVVPFLVFVSYMFLLALFNQLMHTNIAYLNSPPVFYVIRWLGPWPYYLLAFFGIFTLGLIILDLIKQNILNFLLNK